MSLSHFIILALASFGSLDILRRLAPAGFPPLLQKLLAAGIALALLRWAPSAIVAALAVPGAALLVGKLVYVEPYVPWGPAAWDRLRPQRRPPTAAERIGHRIRKL